jgi:hypothetical protein
MPSSNSGSHRQQGLPPIEVMTASMILSIFIGGTATAYFSVHHLAKLPSP